MTRIARFKGENLRLYSKLELTPHERLNLIVGSNAAGKTTLLEGLYILGRARSFRATDLGELAGDEGRWWHLFAELVSDDDGWSDKLGAGWSPEGQQLRLNGQRAKSSELARKLPIQLIDPVGHRLVEDGPGYRRSYLDWGVFHVEHRFLGAWQRLQKALRQRNSWLRHGTLDGASQAAWDRELCSASEEIDTYRRAYIQALKPVFERTLAELLELEGLTLSYYRGWDKDRELSEVLATSLLRDQQLGHTQAGPQRADLRLRLAGHNAAEILSRGQQKLVVCALRIAQGHLVNEAKRGQCIYLVDDLPSELDEQHRQALCRLLEDLRCQVFITCVDHELLREGWQTDTPVAMFHVEHGRITQTQDHRE